MIMEDRAENDNLDVSMQYIVIVHEGQGAYQLEHELLDTKLNKWTENMNTLLFTKKSNRKRNDVNKISTSAG